MGSKNFRVLYDIVRADADAVIRCSACRRVKRVEGMWLVRAMGPMVTLADAGRRLRCDACAHRGANVAAIPKL